MADKIKVPVNGYGTIGKLVADAVARQDEMKSIAETDRSQGSSCQGWISRQRRNAGKRLLHDWLA
jgi:glyceraldehyde-3-phosphate dehydrogenase/erythrose-4-phosphate dehydrogenase